MLRNIVLFFEPNFPSIDENQSPPEATVARTGHSATLTAPVSYWLLET